MDLSQNNILQNDYFKIPIINPFYIVFEPLVKIGYNIKIVSLTKLCQPLINNVGEFRLKVERHLSSINDLSDDAKIFINMSTKGEANLNAGAGIVLGDTNTFSFSFLAGVQGLLGEGEVGFKMLININKLDAEITKHFKILNYDFTKFLIKEIISHLSLIDFIDRTYLLNQRIQGILGPEYSSEDTMRIAIAARLLFDEFQINNRNQLY